LNFGVVALACLFGLSFRFFDGICIASQYQVSLKFIVSAYLVRFELHVGSLAVVVEFEYAIKLIVLLNVRDDSTLSLTGKRCY